MVSDRQNINVISGYCSTNNEMRETSRQLQADGMAKQRWQEDLTTINHTLGKLLNVSKHTSVQNVVVHIDSHWETLF
jgi:hypothetical protein